jgi:hypothetical protein
MKLQIEGPQLRFRVSEVELARLLGSEPVIDRTIWHNAGQSTRMLSLSDSDTLAFSWQGPDITLTLPRTAVVAYAATLPRRDALAFVLGEADAALGIDFEVDVRDSVRTRLVPKTSRADAS